LRLDFEVTSPTATLSSGGSARAAWTPC